MVAGTLYAASKREQHPSDLISPQRSPVPTGRKHCVIAFSREPRSVCVRVFVYDSECASNMHHGPGFPMTTANHEAFIVTLHFNMSQQSNELTFAHHPELFVSS